MDKVVSKLQENPWMTITLTLAKAVLDGKEGSIKATASAFKIFLPFCGS